MAPVGTQRQPSWYGETLPLVPIKKTTCILTTSYCVIRSSTCFSVLIDNVWVRETYFAGLCLHRCRRNIFVPSHSIGSWRSHMYCGSNCWALWCKSRSNTNSLQSEICVINWTNCWTIKNETANNERRGVVNKRYVFYISQLQSRTTTRHKLRFPLFFFHVHFWLRLLHCQSSFSLPRKLGVMIT